MTEGLSGMCVDFLLISEFSLEMHKAVDPADLAGLHGAIYGLWMMGEMGWMVAEMEDWEERGMRRSRDG